MGVKIRESQGCRHVRITVKDEFMKDEIVARIIREIRGEGTILWFSMPCTGGSPWQKYNMKHKSAREKMKGHWKVHKCMWKKSRESVRSPYRKMHSSLMSGLTSVCITTCPGFVHGLIDIGSNQ